MFSMLINLTSQIVHEGFRHGVRQQAVTGFLHKHVIDHPSFSFWPRQLHLVLKKDESFDTVDIAVLVSLISDRTRDSHASFYQFPGMVVFITRRSTRHSVLRTDSQLSLEQLEVWQTNNEGVCFGVKDYTLQLGHRIPQILSNSRSLFETIHSYTTQSVGQLLPNAKIMLSPSADRVGSNVVSRYHKISQPGWKHVKQLVNMFSTAKPVTASTDCKSCLLSLRTH